MRGGAWSAAIASSLALLGSAAGPFPRPRVATLRLVPVPPPISHGPMGGVEDVAFLDARDGFVVTAAANAAFAGSGRGSIQRTADGGASWTTIWSRRRVALGWIGFADARHGFAAGVSFPVGYPQSKLPRPLLLRSDDGGRSWRLLRPRLPPGASW